MAVSPSSVSAKFSRNSIARSQFGLERLRYATDTPTKGRPGLSATPGIGAKPKSIPLFIKFDQAQGPDIIMASLPCAINCSVSLYETLLGRTPERTKEAMVDNALTAPGVATPTLFKS